MEIGQKVRICRLREKVPADIIKKAQQGQIGVIKSFKMTDGSGIGVFVEFPDSTTSWFFEDEVEVVE
ncbi:MAG: DUF2862 domain-containing protein [Geminocystis sp.]|nr:DUF2862 domain-containing protein [Geminocystis sp.]HIK36383.1 DUF2862 domain-containing protein [Geminocystis sp. M7585_C2015_104]MCS7147978.1 DUF2862 domain-containing protein [Geminocystis sp.]MCX8078952.1 DUF2862 domain-containing protein [Geminocystis sp.]MDW8116942.1 DUF2862 domain-containing protein [Geminocystis sp.]